MEDFIQQKFAVRSLLATSGYHNAIKAMDFAEKHHKGKRVGGAPEFSHQVWIASYITAFNFDRKTEEQLLVLAFLHDILEDKKVTKEKFKELFGERNLHLTDILSKVIRTTKETKSMDEYVAGINENPLTVIVKISDRLNNLICMMDTKTPEKQSDYIDNTNEYYLPLVSEAIDKHSEFANIFTMMKTDLEDQISAVLNNIAINEGQTYGKNY